MTGPDKNFGSVDTDDAVVTNIRSDSLPTWRVYKDGSDVVAVDETDTEIGRNTDAQTVWQSACDQANTDFDANEPREPVAKIDGGGLEYTLAAELVIKDGGVVENARFEASGATGAAALTIGGPDDGSPHRAITVRDIVVRDSGTDAYRIRDLADCSLDRLLAENATNTGFEIQSCIANDFKALLAANCGDQGINLSDNGNTTNKCNANVFYGCRLNNNGGTNLVVTNQSKGNTFIELVTENSATFGIDITSTGPPTGNVFLNPWVESNSNIGLDDQGEKTIIIGGTFSDNESGGNQRATRLRGTDTRFQGPVRLKSGDSVTVGGGTDVNIIEVDSIPTDNGTRTRYHNVIGGGPLGGVDLGSVNGQFDGDRAMADGTNASASFGDLAVWDADNTQWLVFNQDATI